MNRFRAAAGAFVLCGVAACASTPAPERPSPVPIASEATPVTPPAMPVEAAPPMEAPHVHEAPPPPPMAAAPAPAEPAPPVAEKTPPRKPSPPPRPEAKPSTAPAAAVANANSLSGRFELAAASAGAILPGELADGLVYFLPKAGAPKPKPGSFSVDTRSKGFSPALLVVPQGSTVRFPNRDTILHNVFSRTPGSSFDFGHYGPGETKQYVFNKPGLVIVNCNVHHNMRADVVVLATPYYTRPDRSGRYTLTGLPAGPGTLVFWHPRAQAQSVAVALPATATVTRKLVATRPSRQEH